MAMDEKKIKLTLVDKVSEKLKSIERSVLKLSEQFQKLGTIGHIAFAYLGFEGVSSFIEMSNEVVELSNRLELLNETVVDTKLYFRDIVNSASQSRTELKAFGEMFNRIGMSSGHFFKSRPGDLITYVSALNKQFQLMHLSEQQLMSVNTAILDATELGYFDWRHMKSLLAHDNPLGRGFLKYMGVSGDDVMLASRNHDLTSDKFMEYVLSQSQEINRQFDKMTLTLGQMGNIIHNSMIESFSDALTVVTKIANVFFKMFQFLGENLPFVSRLMQHLFANTVMLTGAMITFLSVATVLKKLASITMVGMSGGTLGLIIGGLTVLTTIISFIAESMRKRTGSQDNELKENEAQQLDHIAHIDDNTTEMKEHLSNLKDSLNDMITQTENMIIHNQIQNNISLSGIKDPQSFAQAVLEEMKANYYRSGVL